MAVRYVELAPIKNGRGENMSFLEPDLSFCDEIRAVLGYDEANQLFQCVLTARSFRGFTPLWEGTREEAIARWGKLPEEEKDGGR